MRPNKQPWLVFLTAFWPFILGCVCVAGGFAALVIGYFGVSGTVYPGLQLPYLVSGVAVGLALVIVGSALIVSQALGRQARLLRRLLAEMQYGGAAGALVATSKDGAGTQPEDGQLLVARGGRWYHRAGCLLLEGKTTEHITAEAAEFRGLSPCQLCDPVVPVGPVA